MLDLIDDTPPELPDVYQTLVPEMASRVADVTGVVIVSVDDLFYDVLSVEA